MAILPPTIGTAAALVAREITLPRNELNILLAWALKTDRVGLIRDSDQLIDLEKLNAFKKLARRRANGEPIAYIVGQQEFYSRPFLVNPDVLIPRPETEELVDRALIFLEPRSQSRLVTRVLDVGCGCGAIALTLAQEIPLLEVTALDVCEKALAVAKQNAARFRLNNVKFCLSDVFDGLTGSNAGSRFDLIVSNPPYIPQNDSHLSEGDLRFEPKQALTDASDGISIYRNLAKNANSWLESDGAVLVEHGYNQQTQVAELFQQAGFAYIDRFKDLAGLPRMVLAQVNLNDASDA